MAIKLYDSEGKEVFFDHGIDAREATMSGQFFETPPVKEKEVIAEPAKAPIKEKDPVKEKEVIAEPAKAPIKEKDLEKEKAPINSINFDEE